MALVEIRDSRSKEVGDTVEVKLCLKWGYGSKFGSRTFYVPKAFVRIVNGNNEIRIWSREVVELIVTRYQLIPGKSVMINKNELLSWLEFTREFTSNSKLKKYLARYINRLKEL